LTASTQNQNEVDFLKATRVILSFPVTFGQQLLSANIIPRETKILISQILTFGQPHREHDFN